ncbi:hypothetical protein X801_02312, partial [Opisthorchis viverrini]
LVALLIQPAGVLGVKPILCTHAIRARIWDAISPPSEIPHEFIYAWVSNGQALMYSCIMISRDITWAEAENSHTVSVTARSFVHLEIRLPNDPNQCSGMEVFGKHLCYAHGSGEMEQMISKVRSSQSHVIVVFQPLLANSPGFELQFPLLTRLLLMLSDVSSKRFQSLRYQNLSTLIGDPRAQCYLTMRLAKYPRTCLPEWIGKAARVWPACGGQACDVKPRVCSFNAYRWRITHCLASPFICQ